MRYFNELKRSMNFLAQHPDTIFLGQAVEYDGTAMRTTLKDVDPSKLIEWPVCENFQAGVANGLSLLKKIPISIFPRWNFMICATDQIVNHLDKASCFGVKTKQIIRVGIGSERPLHPQAQHVGDYTEAFKIMCPNIDIILLNEPKEIFPAYELALNREDGKSTILVEFADYYNEK